MVGFHVSPTIRLKSRHSPTIPIPTIHGSWWYPELPSEIDFIIRKNHKTFEKCPKIFRCAAKFDKKQLLILSGPVNFSRQVFGWKKVMVFSQNAARRAANFLGSVTPVLPFTRDLDPVLPFVILPFPSRLKILCVGWPKRCRWGLGRVKPR